MGSYGKTAIISGGSRGIGAAIAERLAKGGANIVLTYYSDSGAAESVVEVCKKMGAKADAIQSDAGSVDDGKALVTQVVSQYGSVDILVNNAAVLTATDIKTTTEADFDRNIDGKRPVSPA